MQGKGKKAKAKRNSATKKIGNNFYRKMMVDRWEGGLLRVTGQATGAIELQYDWVHLFSLQWKSSRAASNSLGRCYGKTYCSIF